MRHLARGATGLAAAAALLAAFAGTALAGGWAEATMADGPAEPPTAGEEREIRFTLLQHGVTPVDYGRVQVIATHPETGQQVSVQATSVGGATWTALVTFPVAGDWEIGVTHDSLEVSPMRLGVGESTALAWLPVALVLGGFAAVAAIVVIGMLFVAGRSSAAPTVAGGPARADSRVRETQPTG